MNLDEMAATPSISRLTSTEAKEGYFWDEEWGLYFENDALFRERVKAMYATHEWRGPAHDGETGPA
jgi:hypothetical protein